MKILGVVLVHRSEFRDVVVVSVLGLLNYLNYFKFNG